MGEPTDTELLDWMTREQCSLTCWDVLANAREEDRSDNGWTVEGADGLDDKDLPSGDTPRAAIAWAMKQHAAGKFRTRRDELNEPSHVR